MATQMRHGIWRLFEALLMAGPAAVLSGCGNGGGPPPPPPREWGTAELIETDDAGWARYPKVAMDQNGNAIAVWHQSDGTRDNICANRYVVGSGWGTAELIETDDAGPAANPHVATDPNGNVITVWLQSDGTRNSIWANRYVAGSGWGTAELIETDDGSAYGPQVAMDAGGNATAVWYQDDGTRDNVWANRYDASSGWGTAELLETDTEDANLPQIAMDPGGHAIAVWWQDDGTQYNIWANRYVAGSSWGTAELIETDDAGPAWEPQVAMDTEGNAIAVWKHFDGTRYNIWANRYVAGLTWGAAELIETEVGEAEDPQIAMDQNGNAIAVWEQQTNIWANRYDASSGWGTAEMIETDDAGVDEYPQVAMDSGGNGVAVWHEWDGTRFNIWANRFE